MRALLLALCLLLAAETSAQIRDNNFPRSSPSAAVGQTIGVVDVFITYGRPAARGRVLFGADEALEKYGNVWRAGANEATTFTVSEDVQVEGQPLPEGTYGLFTIPGPERWTIIFNRVPNQWGAYAYDQAQDVLRVEVTPETGAAQEHLLFTFDNLSDNSARVVLHWGTTRVPFTVTTDTDAILLARARERVPSATDWRVPVQFANYALQREMNLPEALTWAERAVTLEENYNTLMLKASLQAATGDLEGAVATGEAALARGRAMENPPGNLAQMEERINGWKSQR